MVLRRSLLPLLALLAIAAASCGAGDRPTEVASGAGAATSTTIEGTTPPSTTPSSTSTAPATTVPTPDSTTSTIAVAPQPGGGTAASPVEGLTADELRAAVEAPVPAANRRAVGPTVDQVTLADGTRVWRVRVPGAFPARAARVEVQVGGRRVGEGVLAPDLQSITAVTTDGSGLTAGRPVTFRWEGGPLEAAGPLELAR